MFVGCFTAFTNLLSQAIKLFPATAATKFLDEASLFATSWFVPTSSIYEVK